jgi:hypothetical protein
MADMAVLFRMLAVYPRAATPLRRRALIIAPVAALKVVRLVALVHLAVDRPGQAGNAALVLSHSQRVYMVVGRFATAIDNACVRAGFAYARQTADGPEQLCERVLLVQAAHGRPPQLCGRASDLWKTRLAPSSTSVVHRSEPVRQMRSPAASPTSSGSP